MGLTAEQNSGAKLDYSLDWSDWLSKSPGDVIASSQWSGPPQLILSSTAFSGPTTSVWVDAPVATPSDWYILENTVTTQAGRRDRRSCLIFIRPANSVGSALFKNRLVALAKIRRDRLSLLANSIMPDLKLSDDYIWEKLLAAESTVAHALRVYLQPTRLFAAPPTPEQIAALGGTPWAIDPPYDYNPSDWYGDKWGLISTRQKPIQSIAGMKFVYPSPAQTIVDVPADWIRMDAKYGQVQIVPTGTSYQTLLGGLFMSTLSGGRTLPFTIHLEYVAGLANVAQDFPDLVDAVVKMAVVKVVEDGFMPQSGSISADGLSQSLSVDVSKYNESVDRALNGEDGNGGLMARIHGIRAMVI
jgi:hypothetical protein